MILLSMLVAARFLVLTDKQTSSSVKIRYVQEHLGAELSLRHGALGPRYYIGTATP